MPKFSFLFNGKVFTAKESTKEVYKGISTYLNSDITSITDSKGGIYETDHCYKVKGTKNTRYMADDFEGTLDHATFISAMITGLEIHLNQQQ